MVFCHREHSVHREGAAGILVYVRGSFPPPVAQSGGLVRGLVEGPPMVPPRCRGTIAACCGSMEEVEWMASSIAEVQALVGQELGVSPWLTVTQEQVNVFADLTSDHQYIHVDPERARQTMYGETIAHGYFTLSLVTRLSRERDGIRINLPCRMTINYGLNRVRFPGPVPVGSTDSAPHQAARRGDHQSRQRAGRAAAGPTAHVPAGHGSRRPGAPRYGRRDAHPHLLLSSVASVCRTLRKGFRPQRTERGGTG